MKFILFLTVLFPGTFLSFSQEDDEYFREDSIHLTQFLQQVYYIELCELGLTCYIDTIHLDDTDEQKIVERCYLGGAIKYPKIDFSKITCRKRATKMDDFFRLLISSTKNISHISGVCYEPRNGILFFDKDEKLLGYLEICFACSHSATLSRLGGMGFTYEQYVELECLFIQDGLKTK